MSQEPYARAKAVWQQYFRWCQFQEAGPDDLTDAEMAEYDVLEAQLEDPSPELCFAVAHDLLGCQDSLPEWLARELQDHESVPDDVTTYHGAAVELLTEHIIDGYSPRTWVRQLYPVFVKDAPTKGLPETRQGFEAWLAAMTTPADCQQAMRQWPPPA